MSARKPTALDVAAFFLSACDEYTAGDLISNLKMQKLVYYAQGFHLALTGERLFDEPIEAWQYGPVVYSLYDAFREFGNGALDLSKLKGYDIDIFSDEQKELLKDVYTEYGQYSAWALKNMTHSELPWKATTNDGNTIGLRQQISDKLLKQYFKDQLVKS
ncbi:MAG: DUF4065 domain-containing protein [Helicobacteraceae bacterium]|nr:DUF4065 domain-containing protein [Helicobacteraceae bacterium]